MSLRKPWKVKRFLKIRKKKHLEILTGGIRNDQLDDSISKWIHHWFLLIDVSR